MRRTMFLHRIFVFVICLCMGVGVSVRMSFPAQSDLQPCMVSGQVTEARFQGISENAILRIDGAREVVLAGIIPATADGMRVVSVLEQSLRSGEVISLVQFDEPYDRYGRLRAYVMSTIGEATVWLQKEMVVHGIARVSERMGPRTCIMFLLDAEKKARQEGRNLWGEGVFKIHSVQQPELFTPLMNSFQIIKGRVVSVGRGKRVIFVNFGSVWSEDFTLLIPLRQEKNFAAWGIVLSNLVGKQIYARGWIEKRGGPAITLSDPVFLEVVE